MRAWWTQLEISMRSLRVAVRGVLGQHPAGVRLPKDQHPIGEFGADGQHEAFGEAVRLRTPRRDLDHHFTGNQVPLILAGQLLDMSDRKGDMTATPGRRPMTAQLNIRKYEVRVGCQNSGHGV
jgi:hypothetical protein